MLHRVFTTELTLCIIRCSNIPLATKHHIDTIVHGITAFCSPNLENVFQCLWLMPLLRDKARVGTIYLPLIWREGNISQSSNTSRRAREAVTPNMAALSYFRRKLYVFSTLLIRCVIATVIQPVLLNLFVVNKT